MFESLLPPGVHGVEGPILSGEWDATPEEWARTAGHIDTRKAEFLTGRTYARRALRALGVAAPTIGWNPDRSPIWPPGVIGCITHTRDHCAAVAARTGTSRGMIRGVGIDIETLGRITDAMALKTFTEAERSDLAALPDAARQLRMCAIFCAKEAFYKMQFPLTQAWVGFQDVEVKVEARENGILRLTLRKEIAGRWAQGREFPVQLAYADGLAGALAVIEDA